jgi:transposase
VTRAAPIHEANLPADAEALRALLLATMAERDAVLAERDAAIAERDALAIHNERLAHLLLRLKRLQFGRKSERLPEEQLQLGFEDLEAAIAKGDAEAERRDPELKRERAAKRRANRGKLPAHLPRIEVELAPEDTACPCCRAAMVVIGEDTSERLDVIPAQFRVVVTRRPKLACRACAGTVVQQPAPPRLIEGGIPTEATVAHVLVSRYADHLPLYRQAQIWTRQGVALDRSTLAAWVGTAAAEIAPVVGRLKEILLTSARLFADETVVPVLDPGRGRTKQGYFWAELPKVPAAQRLEWQRRGSPATTGHGAAVIPRLWSTPMPPGAGTTMAAPCSAATAASCNATVMPPTRSWLILPRAAPASWPSVGAMFAAASMISPRAATRRSRRRRWSASPRCIGLRPTSAAAAPRHGKPRARPGADRCTRSCAPGSRPGSRGCLPVVQPPRRSAMRCTIGTGSCGSSMTDASKSTATPSNGACDPLRYREKIASLRAATLARHTAHLAMSL